MPDIERDNLRNHFLCNVDSWFGDVGIIETQIPTINRLIDTLISASDKPKQVIKSATRPTVLEGIRHESDFWSSLKSLMRQVGILSGQELIYSPGDFVESMRPWAGTQRQTHLLQGMDKNTAINPQDVMRIADECVSDRDFVLDFLADGFLPRANYEDNLKRYTKPSIARHLARENRRLANISYRYMLKKDNPGELHGMMRSVPYCGQASQFLFQALEDQIGDATLFWADGRVSPYFYQHYVVMISHTDFWPEDKKPKNIKSEYLINGEKVAEFGNMIVVDSTILQVFGHNAFLASIPYKERVPFIRTIDPDLFSETGVFVGNFVEYIYMLSLLGLTNPEFDLSDSLPEYIHP